MSDFFFVSLCFIDFMGSLILLVHSVWLLAVWFV